MKATKPDNITNNDWNLLTKKYHNLHRIVKKINRHYPVQYLIGDVNFYGHKIFVKKGVLIPRFETETLVEKTMAYLKDYGLEEANVLEIGTGSACIPIALKKELPFLNITSIEKSHKAFLIAKKNLKYNNVQIDLLRKDLFQYIPSKKFDVIISNPPYLSKDEVIDEECRFEPSTALFAENNGLNYYDYIIKNCKKWLNKKSLIAFEIGYKQGPYLKELATKYFQNAKVVVEKDLANKDRYLFIINE